METQDQPHTFRRTTAAPATSTKTRARTGSGRSISQYLALVVGLAFVGAGVAGFFVTGLDITGFDDFFARDTDQFLLGLEINPAHNVVHLVIGLLGLALWWTLAGARTFGALLFIGYGAAFVYGLFAVDNDDINVLSMNTADNWFHLASALVGLVIVALSARRR
ncbi:MAG: DUF4383 domain-containing protein [Actinobacteria bacterium]|nr:DUF4383 domain-containing protein [Actinomycetota bacterium]